MLASMHAMYAREHARDARSSANMYRENARELVQKNEYVHSCQNAREHARKLFYFSTASANHNSIY